MPTQTYPYLVISDLITSTVTFQDGAGGLTNWQLAQDGWAPTIPAFNPSAVAGRGQYTDVTEEFIITVRGANAAACYTNLDTLARLLDQAERFRLNEPVNPVLLRVAPQGSTISSTADPLQAMVLGRAPGDQTSGVSLPGRWGDGGLFYEIPNVKVRVWRRGQWLHSPQSAASASTNNGSLATVNLGAALNAVSPTQVVMSNYPSAATDRGLLVISSNDTNTRLVQADPSAGTAAGWTAVNESANFSRNTNVLRYTPGATTESTSGSITINPTSNGPLWAVFANVRNNSSTTNFQLRAQLLIGGGYISAYTPLTYIAPFSGAAAPGWVHLGFVSLPSSPATVRCLATASAAAGTLDIGDLLVVDAQYAGTYILAYTPSESNALVKTLTINHALLTKPAPTTMGAYPYTIEGDMTILTNAQNVVVANLIVSASANDWRQTSGGAVTANVFTLTRHIAYLPPM